jgi:hypothetical protein
MHFSLQIKNNFFHHAARLARAAGYVLLVSAFQPAAHASTYVACPSCSFQSLVWSEGEFEQVHLVANGGAAGNLHPQTLPVEGLSKALISLRTKSGGAAKPLLNEESAASLARGLAAALAKATPQQDLLFLVTSAESGSGLFVNKLGSSGRAFMDKNGLNIILAEANVDFVSAYRGTKKARAFDFGTRSSASGMTLEGAGMSSPRNDWVVLPIAAMRAQTSAAGGAAAALPAVRDEQYYAAQESRLKALKRLRDQNLITEDEYQGKRNEIMKDW